MANVEVASRCALRNLHAHIINVPMEVAVVNLLTVHPFQLVLAAVLSVVLMGLVNLALICVLYLHVVHCIVVQAESVWQPNHNVLHRWLALQLIKDALMVVVEVIAVQCPLLSARLVKSLALKVLTVSHVLPTYLDAPTLQHVLPIGQSDAWMPLVFSLRRTALQPLLLLSRRRLVRMVDGRLTVLRTATKV